jgi:predicted phosphodiesterase
VALSRAESVRLALVSDLHGHLPGLEAIIIDARRVGVDAWFSLGDVVDMGPQPNEVIARLRELGARGVGGNHDPLDERPPIPKLAAMEAWTREALTPESRAWLDALPFDIREEIGGARVWFAHGSPRSDTDQVLADTPEETLRDWLSPGNFDLFACGHTHVQCLRRLDGRAVVNVGSAGMPFEGPFRGAPPRALPWVEYAIVELRAGRVSVDLRQVPYDFEEYRRAMFASGCPEPEAWLADWVAPPR